MIKLQVRREETTLKGLKVRSIEVYGHMENDGGKVVIDT